VQLNGATRRDPEAAVHLEKDRIELDGRRIAAADRVYLMLNKARGVVTTASDENARQTVYAFLGPDSTWVAPVGRLDKASEGLLLLTNDSEWASRVLAPATHLDKTYHVQIGRVADQKLLAAIARECERKMESSFAREVSAFFAAASATPGSRSCSMRARTGIFAACCRGLESRCCAWCALRWGH
jgi:23S rRNA pseudouridine2605 synthase